MAGSIASIIRGIDYQANYAWLFICDMLKGYSHIDHIEYEASDKKSFDDIVVHYYRSKPRLDCNNRPVYTECYQIKFHVDYSNVITLSNLMNPSFISATSKSILNRLTELSSQFGAELDYTRFYLSTLHSLDPNDILATLLSTHEGELRLSKLFDSSTKSKMSKIRGELVRHMGLHSEAELYRILLSFRIKKDAWNEQELINLINVHLDSCGLAPIDISCSLNPYQQLVETWTKKDIKLLTREFVMEECSREGLVVKKELKRLVPVGIRSFFQWAENMQDETESMLCLINYFEGRLLKNEYKWSDVCSEIENYIKTSLRSTSTYEMFLDTHLCISFFIGRILNSKSGIVVNPIQKTPGRGRKAWTYMKGQEDDGGADWIFEYKRNLSESEDFVLVISVTHDIRFSVEEYICQTGTAFATELICKLPGDVSNTSVRGGLHAKKLVESITRELNERTAQQKRGCIYLFMAAPVAFAFFLGQLSCGWGKTILHEYDFEKLDSASYYPTIVL